MKTIRELREARGWSQFDVAVKTGVTPNTVGRWERGEVEPKFSTMRRLAALFGVSLDQITLTESEGKTAAQMEPRRRQRPNLATARRRRKVCGTSARHVVA